MHWRTIHNATGQSPPLPGRTTRCPVPVCQYIINFTLKLDMCNNLSPEISDTSFWIFYGPHSEGMGKVMFSQTAVRSHLRRGGGGYPLPWSGRWRGEYPLPRSGWGGYPLLRSGQGVLHPKSGQGGQQDWIPPCPGQDKGVPPSQVRTGREHCPPPVSRMVYPP